jgi:hypothetical protein
MAAEAISAGAVPTSPVGLRWDVSGGCRNPRYVAIHGRQERGRPKVRVKDWAEFSQVMRDAWKFGGSYTVELDTPCRRCDVCLRRRADEWKLRAKRELLQATRTWFCTLTLSPEQHFLMECRASTRLSAGGTTWHDLSADDKFKERHIEIGAEITKYFKRLRKQSGAALRYFVVAEAHKSGLPHYHMLVHERGGVPVTERMLRKQWGLGHSQFKLCPPADKRAAYYVCKYLSKSALARIRASTDYGKLSERVTNEDEV